MKRLLSVFAVLLVLSVLLVSCKSKGGGGGSGTTPPPVTQTTTVSGKVTLSSTVTGAPAAKATLKAMMNAPKGKPGSALYYATKQSVGGSLGKTLMAASAASTTPLANAVVYLYNADHPEWLCPVAESTTDSNGNYTLSTMTGSLSTGQTYAACNGDVYTDGDELIAAKYTLLAIKAGGFDLILGITTPTVVAVQTVVKNFEGIVSGNDLVAQPSDATPTVGTVFGVAKNTDGTQTWGSASTSLPGNTAIQITFNMAMSRGTLENGVSMTPSVTGTWSLSADWLTATFYPASGVTLTPSTLYTITVKGTDTSTTPIRNVYGNALAKTATGKFTATAVDTVAPSAVWVSPTTLEMGSAVDVIKPIRIGANKQLDINGLLLDGKIGGVSSFGAKPGVLYLGKETTGVYAGYYIYEFVLADPLKLSTTYDLTVTGGKGLNGLAMNDLLGSLVTVSASESTGIDATADAVTQDAQAQVKDVFGKWYRAFSDQNLTQLQSVMSGDFYFEYDPSYGIDSETDLNRDGRYSLQEFSDMLANMAFPMWKYCGTTITGDVVGTINVVGENADFEFKLIGTSTITSEQCTDTMPDSSLYATLQKINGAWVIIRTSEGIDTRTKTISYPKLINIELSQGGTVIADGGKLATTVLNDTSPATFSWDAVSGAMSYVVMVMDSRNPDTGVAIAMSSSVTSFSPSVKDPTFVDVSCKFGFCKNGPADVRLVEGGEYLWEVVALGTIAKADIDMKSDSELIRDITAVSSLDRFSIDGVFKELKVTVYPGTSASGMPLTYNEMFGGFDAGTGVNKATLLISTPSTSNVYIGVNVNGSSSKFYTPTNQPTACPSTGCTATVTIDLFKGWNWISVNDGTGGVSTPGQPSGPSGLFKDFSVQAPDGIPPVISITSVVNQSNVPIVGDSWGYYDSTVGGTVAGATKVTVNGSVLATDPSSTNSAPTNVTQVNVNVWNNDLGAYTYVNASVTNGLFSATVEIYKGDNWINIGNSGGTGGGDWMYNAHAGVYTDTGTTWVAPIALTDVVGATKNYDWGNSSDWDASLDADDKVTVKIQFKAPLASTGNCGTTYNYNLNSDGSNVWGELHPNTDGSLSLDVDLYTGWNYVSFSDPNCNWYGVNIYTSDGKVVVKPIITTINGVAYTYPTQGGTGSAAISTCQVTITGTAQNGDVQVNWNGYDGATYWGESQVVQATGGSATTPGTFSATMPAVSGSGAYNNIDIFDLNWKWTGVKITTTGTCPYSPPVLTIGTLTDSSGNAISLDTYGYSYQAGTSNTVTINGTSTRSGDKVSVRVWSCGVEEKYETTASTSSNGSGAYDWSVSGVKVYGNNGLGQNTYIDIYNNYTWTSVSVYSTNTQTPPNPPLNVATVNGISPTYQGCGYKEWDLTSVAIGNTVTIVGTTTAPAGEGHYTDPTGGSYPFTIDANGNFSFTVDVYNGYNNISINDTDWNWTNISVNTTNARLKPKVVAITSPVNGATGISGTQTVSGTIDVAAFIPSQVHAYISAGKKDAYGYCTYTSTDYTTDQYQQSNFGYKPITLDTAAVPMTFSFSVDFGDGTCETYISVDAYDDVSYQYHGHSLSVNTLGYTPYENWYKPGAKKGPSMKQVANEQRALMHRLAIGSK